MKKYDYGTVEILIADQNIQLRSGLKGMLHQSGFRNIIDASNLEQLEEIVKRKCPDVLLCDYHLPGGEVCKTIRKLRHSQCGQNPFSSVILFIEEPTKAVVQAASEAGLDDLQIKPIVAQKVLDRIAFLIEKRKPFVVTTDYIGPDRRSGKRPDAMEIPTMPVPNSLSQKANGTFDETLFQIDVDTTVWKLNEQKIERHAFQIGYLVERIVPAYRENKFNRESLGMLAKLVQVSKDIAKRLEESDFAHIANLVSTLETVAKSLWESGTQPRKKDLDLLPELSAAISATFKATPDNQTLTGEIITSVKQKYTS